MESKIKKAIELNKSLTQKLNKELTENLNLVQKMVNKNVAENNVYEMINHLPGYLRGLEDIYIKLKNLDEENQKLEYFLKAE